MNPFKIDGIVSGADYMPRKETKTLLEYQQAGRNVLVLGPRRTGKSSLIVNTFSGEDFQLVRVDFWGVKTEEKATEKIARALSAFDKKVPGLTGLNVGAVGLSWTRSSEMNGVEEALRRIPILHKKKPVVVFFDEFQCLMDLQNSDQFLGALRSEIQAQSDISYIFAGSNHQKLTEMFYAQRNPFFKSAAQIEIGVLEKGAFSEWLNEKFSRTNRTVSSELWNPIFSLVQSIPGDVQDICYHLWNDSQEGDEIDAEQLEFSVRKVIHERSAGYLSIWGMLTDNQQRVALGVATYQGNHYLSAEFMHLSGTTSSASVKRGLDSLADKGIIWKHENRWIFSDPFFTWWVIGFAVGEPTWEEI